MERLRSWVSRFFTGVRLILPRVPGFVWIALKATFESTVDYWKNSQSIVDNIADEYMRDVMEADEKMHAIMQGGETIGEYDKSLYLVCYSIASFLYLLGWLAMSWLTVEAFLLLTSLVF
jgi:hypothetical protein